MPRPLSITIISWLLIVVGVVTFVSGWVPRAGSTAPATQPREHSSAEFASICTVRALAAVAGVFMLRRRDWARWLALAWFAFHVIISGSDPTKLAVHLLLLAIVTYFLLRPRAWAYFRSGMPVSEPSG